MPALIPLFKSWVPAWLVRVTMFVVLLPSFVLFFLPLSNVTVTAGYYGIEPADVQFSVVIFYVGYTSFFSLEKRFFRYLATKEYFFIFTLIQLLTSFICYETHSLLILLIFRFIQGMMFTSTANLALALIFNRLHSQRARAIAYSVFFGMLVCIIPFNNFITADMLDATGFNTVFRGAIISYLPGLFLLAISMNNVRLNIKFPLYLLDWESFLFYGSFLSLFGYVMVYGQERYWFEDRQICIAVALMVFFLVLFWIRQFFMKRPYFVPDVFRYRNFILGGGVLFILYLCRFTLNFSSAYFTAILGFDPRHLSYINLFNIGGIAFGVITSCVYLLQNRPIRLIWIYGFLSLLVFHVWMFFLFSKQGNADNYFVPIFLHGLGVGLLIVPCIIFMISSVPVSLGDTAAGICLFVRCSGFISSIALINYYDLLKRSTHFNAFMDRLSGNNPLFKQTLLRQSKALVGHGLSKHQAPAAATRLLVKQIGLQAQVRSAMDYYVLITGLIVMTLIIIALFPYVNRTVIRLRKDQPAPF
ncbi:MAG: transporter [Mucilaginibacter sp.]|uniref:transporter n=1 Tax=Mucilaginibacter sp. TaxID=1882438 RepID=UPI0031A9A85D